MKSLRALTAVATLALLGGLASHSTAAAEQPECPCWSETSLLAVVTDLVAARGPVESCDPHPIITTNRFPFGVNQSARILGPAGMEGYDITAFAGGLGNSIGEPERICSIREADAVIAEDVAEAEFWRCMNDITQLCRDLGLPPIE